MTDREHLRARLLQRAFQRCARLAGLGRHRGVLDVADEAIELASGSPELEAEALAWKAQAFLALGRSDEAVVAAERAWELSPDPQACYIAGCALADHGELEAAERILGLGADLFPDESPLKIRLAMLLMEIGRIPEALDRLEEIDDNELEGPTAMFVHGLRANLLGLLGHWAEAEAALDEGLERFPEADLLIETGTALHGIRARVEAERRLLRDWEDGFEPLHGGAVALVDATVAEIAQSLELPALVPLAARRLWRGFLRADPIRPIATEAWAAALIVVVSRLDGQPIPATEIARVAWAVPETVRSAARRIEAWLGTLDPRFVSLQYAALTNPRLEEQPKTRVPNHHRERASILRFPGTDPKGDLS